MTVELQKSYHIKAFIPEEITEYKSMRLEALSNEPGMFGNSYDFESSFTDQQWLDRVNNPNGLCLGLYFYNQLIGITSIIIDQENPNEAYLTQSYIEKQFRG